MTEGDGEEESKELRTGSIDGQVFEVEISEPTEEGDRVVQVKNIRQDLRYVDEKIGQPVVVEDEEGKRVSIQLELGITFSNRAGAAIAPYVNDIQVQESEISKREAIDE